MSFCHLKAPLPQCPFWKFGALHIYRHCLLFLFVSLDKVSYLVGRYAKVFFS